MLDTIIWLIVIPTTIMAIKFWFRVATWGLRNKRNIATRVQRVRAAVAAASGDVEE